MKQLTFSLIFIAAIISTTFAQQVAPTPPKSDDPVIKISTDLIQVDVTVTDKNGKIVTDLKQDEFELFENGEKQAISNFSLIDKTAGGAMVGGGNAADIPGTPNTSAGGTLQFTPRRTIAVIVDDLSMSFQSVFYARKALTKFVDDQMQPGDLVAIIRTGGSVGSLQQFTSDKRLLRAAIERIRWNPFGGNVDALSPVSQNNSEISQRFREESDAVASGDPKRFVGILTRESIADTKTMDYKASKNLDSAEKNVYAMTTFGVIRHIVEGMGKLRGRKSVMLFSDGFVMGGDSGKSKGSAGYDFLRDIADVASRSSVVLNTFDTRGLQAMNITASDSTYEVIGGPGGREGKVASRTKDFKDAQDGLVFLAEQTGGKALLNSNDLNGGIERTLYEQSSYYLIGYVPDADSFDATKRKFNRFEVKVTRPGVKVTYRSGFFSTGPVAGPKPQLSSAEREMADALMSPFTESDISVNVNALYADDPVDGAYVRSFLHIDAKDLTFTEEADGWKTATFDVAAVLFGDNGAASDSKEAKYTIKTKGQTYDTMLKNGFVYVLMVPIKKPGLYQYRVALRDTGTGKIGSASQVLEIPNLTKQKLTISSMAVENVSMGVWQNIAAGKVGNGPGQIQVPSTLLYDTVLRQFHAGSVLRYGFEVYNARAEGSALPQLETQTKIFQGEKLIVQGNQMKFDATGQADPKHVRISGNMLLKDTLQPGDYVFHVTVTDTQSKQVSTQVFPFQIAQ